MNKPDSFPLAKAAQAALIEAHNVASARLDAIRQELAARLGIAPRDALGLTPDAIKARPEWRAAKAECDSAFAALRAFNAWFVKRFARERREERRARR